MTAQTKTAPFLEYGSLIHAWRNEVKFTFEMVAGDTGISKDRLVALEKGFERPSWDEMEKLAKEFRVGVRDLLPFADDRDRGIVSLRNTDARNFDRDCAFFDT